MGSRLKNKVAIVTGSGQGIGLAIAVAMAKEGASVITNNRSEGTDGGDAKTAAEQINSIGGDAIPFFGDVANFEVAEQLVKTATENFGKLDILVNNAGADRPHMIWNMTEEEWDISVNSFLKGSFNTSRFACGVMRENKWGRIINTTSTAWLGTVGHCNYGAAKAGIVGLTRAVAREMGKYNVTCNAYAPTASTRFSSSEDIQAGFKKRYESGLMTKERYEELTNLPDPMTLTPFLVYLCTNEAADINGQVFDVTGGNITMYSEPVRMKSIDKKEGIWTIDELIKQVPTILPEGYKNPAPPSKE
ncbi:MAG: SDR family NAD(P)-dependent oxidoreductase [Dehalococcoidales bacterium]|nr:SDR family NAD(P)-dependent oxidoreductase [Dehalococcoidales bacterium]